MGVCHSSTKSHIKVVTSNPTTVNGILTTNGSGKLAPPPPKLLKKDSNLNLLPSADLLKMQQHSDETIFDREKRMAVLLVPTNPDGQAQLAFIDVDFQSATYCKVLSRMTLPNTGDELYHFACIKNNHSSSRLFAASIAADSSDSSDSPSSQKTTSSSLTANNFTLIVPVPNHSRIYVLSLLVAEGSAIDFRMQLRLQKCISREDLARWDVAWPLSVVSNNAGRRQTSLPLLICAGSDKNDHTKGDLLRLDRRTFALVERRRDEEETRSITASSGIMVGVGGGQQHQQQRQQRFGYCPSAMPSPESSPLIGGGATRFPNFGGSIAVHVRQGLLFSTEWGNIARILEPCPRLFDDSSTISASQAELDSQTYGHSLNIWELGRRKLRQTLRLNPVDGRWAICVRMLHQSELTHGFLCSAIGSSIFHLHKSSRTGLFTADRVIRFSSVPLSDWAGDVPEVPAFCTDMVISMDDHFLYCCAAFHGFVAQFMISDPFRPSLTQKIFLGGLMSTHLGVLPAECNHAKDSSTRVFNVQNRTIGGRAYEGGPSRLQLSLDGRRLYVSNSFLRNWDAKFFPKIANGGASIVLINVDKEGKMELDEQFLINFDGICAAEPTSPTTGMEQQQRNGGGGGGLLMKKVGAPQGGFCLREMRFLNGDSTSDCISIS